MRLRTGTSGFAYKEWKGPFYPEDLPAAEMLRFYAGRLGACEINNTFYRMPRANVLEAWAAEVPSSFRFVLKASRQITHMKRLKAEAVEPARYFMGQARTLGDRLGPVLFQLPPNLKADLTRLRDFLAGLPDGCRAAFEFRHDSWYEDAVLDELRHRGAALVQAEDEAGAAPRVATADWGYLRLRRQDYDDAALASWVAWLRSQSWDEAYVFFKHEDAGAGPRLARRFEEMFEGGSA